MEPFRLFELPAELLGDVLEFVQTVGIVRLWTTGDRRAQFVLSLPRVVRTIRISRTPPEVEKWVPTSELSYRFPHLYNLNIYTRSGDFARERPHVLLAMPQLPRSLKKLHLYIGNAESLLLKPLETPEAPPAASKYYNLAELLPSLTHLELNGNPILNGAWLTSGLLPPNLTRLLLPENDLMTPSDVLQLPSSISDLCLSDFRTQSEPPALQHVVHTDAPFSTDGLPSDATDRDHHQQQRYSQSLESMMFMSRDGFYGTIDNFYRLLPIGLKKLQINASLYFGREEMELLPSTLTVLECSQMTVSDPSLFSRFLHLQRLSFNGENCRNDITKLLPRNLVRLAMRRYRYIDDDYWSGLPKTLTSTNVLSLHHFNAAAPRPSLTRACVPHIPPLLSSLDLSKASDLLPEDFALFPKGLVRVTVPTLCAESLRLIPRSIECINAGRGCIDEDLVRAIPPLLRRLTFNVVELVGPTCLKLLPESLDELRLATSRAEFGRPPNTFVFEDEWASFFPTSLRKLSIRCSNTITDQCIANLADIPLQNLELHGRNARFTPAIIALLPRTLQWMELDGLQGWTLSQEELANLPQKLHWMYVTFVDTTSVPLISNEELKKRLPPRLTSHNIPTAERPNPFGYAM